MEYFTLGFASLALGFAGLAFAFASHQVDKTKALEKRIEEIENKGH
ncbi:hypothetical protein [Sporosarcina sp. G11-34]|nr:hypothetical protein [Sporosarcina sp. G11-34]MCZ2260913.1 hypothetical protein [Sporosarcina sp. G11-34]